MNIILQGAAAEMEQKGADFTMDSLAKRLHISKRTIYEKYESKNQIINLIFELKMDDLRIQHDEILSNDKLSFQEKLSQYFAVQSRVYPTIPSDKIRAIQDKVPQVLVHINAKIEVEWIRLEEFLRKGQADGNIGAEVDIHILMLMLRGIYSEMINNPQYSVLEIGNSLQKAMMMLIGGIAVK